MKFTHYILAFYTLLLSCIPCRDGAEFAVDDTVRDVVNISHDTKDEAVPDLCSPFCICACCSGIMLQQAVASLPDVQILSFPLEKTFKYSNRVGSGDLKAIWQPPRV